MAEAPETTIDEQAEAEQKAAIEAQEKREKESEPERHGGIDEYTLAGPVQARQVTVPTKATGFPEHHLIAKPGWWIVTLSGDAGGIYSGHPIEFVLPPEAFEAVFEGGRLDEIRQEREEQEGDREQRPVSEDRLEQQEEEQRPEYKARKKQEQEKEASPKATAKKGDK